MLGEGIGIAVADFERFQVALEQWVNRKMLELEARMVQIEARIIQTENAVDLLASKVQKTKDLLALLPGERPDMHHGAAHLAAKYATGETPADGLGRDLKSLEARHARADKKFKALVAEMTELISSLEKRGLDETTRKAISHLWDDSEAEKKAVGHDNVLDGKQMVSTQ